MNNIDWGMIGAVATIGSIVVAVIIAILQNRASKKNQDNGKQNNQIVKGLFISNNKIEQKNK